MKTTWLFRPHSFFTATLVVAVATLLQFTAPSALAAGPFYWDCNDGDPGFGTAQGSFAGTTIPTATYGWSTNSTGSTAISGGAGVNPGTAGNVYFGTSTDGLGSGTITVGGTQNIGDITFGSASGEITLNGGTLIQGAAANITVNNSLDTINSVVKGSGNGLTIAGSGTLALNGLNGFTGKLTIGNNGANTLKVQFNTIDNVGAATGSSLGQPATAVNGRIQIGANSKTSTLEFTGASAAGSTDRQVQVGSPSGVGGATILNNNADSAYSLSFANAAFNVAVSTASGRNLTLGGTNTGNNQIQGVIADNNGTSAKVAVVKSDSGTWILSGANTYSGNTTITAGTLALSGDGKITNSASIVVASNAVFDVSGLSSAFTLAQALSSQTLSNSAPGAIINGTNDCSAGTISLVYDGVNPCFTQTNGGMALSTATIIQVKNTGAQLAAGSYTLITNVTAGNAGLVAGAVTTSPITVTGAGAAGVATLAVSDNKLNLVITAVVTNVKANNTLDLANSLSWTIAVPTSAEVAKWDSTVTAANATVLGADLTWAGVQIANPGGLVTINTGNTLTLGAAAIDIDLSAATADLTLNCDLALGAANVWDVTTGRTLTVGGAISGANNLTKQGAGTTTITGVNNYAGVTTVSGGYLVISNGAALGATSGNTVVSGGNLWVGGGITCAEPITAGGNGTSTPNIPYGVILSYGSNTLSGLITVTNSTCRMTTAGTEPLTLSGGMTNAGAVNTILVGEFNITNNPINLSTNPITFGGDGSNPPLLLGKTARLNVVGNNWSYARINYAGIVQLGVDNAMPANAGVIFGHSAQVTSTNSRSTLDLNGHIQTVASIETVTLASGNIYPISITGGGTLTVDQSADKTFAGVISDGATPTSLVKTGIGSLILNNTNTYTGNTTISAGTLQLGNGTNGQDGTISASLSISNNSALVYNLYDASTYGGVISGSGTVTKTGPGTLTLIGTNTYTGDTIVSNGTLVIQVASIATNSTVSVAAGAQLQLNFAGGETNIVAAFYTNGVSLPNGVYSAGSVGSFLVGTGSLKVIGGSVPPTPAQLTNSISGSTLTLTWPSGQGWTLKSQTNSLSSGLNPNLSAWGTVSGGIDGSNSITINPANPTVFYRLFWTP